MSKKPHYVNNKEFLQAMKDWRNKCEQAKKDGKQPPPITNYIGECFLKNSEITCHIDQTLLITHIVRK